MSPLLDDLTAAPFYCGHTSTAPHPSLHRQNAFSFITLR
ncbi:hypothetical protein BSU04_10190 [Caballeronia sordidicola]|uniref:Uncharacterized protein n=1 Tax=Caballeronia sordidicola TaxID=196367 RepID=A0A226X5Y2_CABSO|nr:hypothetical protein BSU04_10190 [Caballeronia sordidicola]